MNVPSFAVHARCYEYYEAARIMLLRLARWTQPDFCNLAADRGRAQLLTIPYSHFCELGAWSLRAASIQFDEHAFAPGLHVLPMLSLRVAGAEKRLSSSSAVTAVESVGAAPTSRRPYKPHHATAVPACCVCLDGYRIHAV